jgi:hypothetical protein
LAALDATLSAQIKGQKERTEFEKKEITRKQEA